MRDLYIPLNPLGRKDGPGIRFINFYAGMSAEMPLLP